MQLWLYMNFKTGKNFFHFCSYLAVFLAGAIFRGRSRFLVKNGSGRKTAKI